MTQQIEQGRFYIDHRAVITARMPDADELAFGYPPGVPVLVLTSHGGRNETVFASSQTELIFGDPDGVPELAEVTAAADFVFGIIAEDLATAGGKLAEFVRAVASSPGSVVRLADEYRQERFTEMFCADVGQCAHATRAAAEFGAGVEVPSIPGAILAPGDGSSATPCDGRAGSTQPGGAACSSRRPSTPSACSDSRYGAPNGQRRDI